MRNRLHLFFYYCNNILGYFQTFKLPNFLKWEKRKSGYNLLPNPVTVFF